MQSNIDSVTFEYPGYVQIVMRGGRVVIVGPEAINVWNSEDHMLEGADCDLAESLRAPFAPAMVESIETIPGYGLAGTDVDIVTLTTGHRIVLQPECVTVYDDSRQIDPKGAIDPAWPLAVLRL